MGEASKTGRITAGDLIGVLLGRREAILRAASTRTSLLIGAAFVMLGGLARSYDQTSLTAEPWALIRGFPVTMAISGSMFLIVLIVSMCRVEGPRTIRLALSAYLSFLGVYWLTAPMAWLYAVPYERLMPLKDAIGVNLMTLLVVSIWRVVLMARVVSVVFGAGFPTSQYIVVFASGAWATLGLYLYEGPMLTFMGGVQLAPQDEALSTMVFLIGALLFLSAPIWGIGGVIAMWWIKPRLTGVVLGPTCGLSASAIAMLIVPTLVLGAGMLRTQPEQALRHRADVMLRAGRVADAINFMNRFRREDFPPQWDPAPRLGWNDPAPAESELVDGLAGADWSTWAGELLGRRLTDRLVPDYRWGDLARKHEGKWLPSRHWYDCERLRAFALIAEKAHWLTEPQRDEIRLLIRACEEAGLPNATQSPF